MIFPYQLCDGKAFLIDETVMKHKYPMTYPIFTEKEVEELLSIQNKDGINNWLARYYS